MSDSPAADRTRIFRRYELPIDAPADTPEREDEIGYVDADGLIYRLRWGEGTLIGRSDAEGRIHRTTTHGEREVGKVLPNGVVQSAGLFAGGDAGWVSADGSVTHGGLILGEDEVGRVEGGMHQLVAGAALLLIFLPDEREAQHAARD